MLTIAEMPTAPDIGRALYAESKKPDNFNDRWLSRALYIAATQAPRHVPDAVQGRPERRRRSPRCRWRCGSATPSLTGARPAAGDLKSDWKDMQVPGAWETRGLPDFDGVVWFSRTVDVPEGAAPTALSLGRVSNIAEVWVNGLSVSLGPGAGRGAAPAPAADAAADRRSINCQPERCTRAPTPSRCGSRTTATTAASSALPDSMFVDTGAARVPLAGTWRYRVERQTNAGDAVRQAGRPRGARRLHRRRRPCRCGRSGACRRSRRRRPDVVLRLAVVPGQMKFDTSELTVAPNQTVEIVFVNPDGMQHNFVLGAQGSLDTLGAAADVVARSPNGLAQQYVPDSPAVLFSTKLLEPGQTVSFQFKAPGGSREVSLRLHVPGALENDERHPERRRARGPRPGRAVGGDQTCL